MQSESTQSESLQSESLQSESLQSESTQSESVQEHVDVDDFGCLDIRVGEIISAHVHPEADSLYVEVVDVGESEPRVIVSGLRKHVPLDEFIGKKVLVLCNLKPRKMRGIMSNGMLLCACEMDVPHEEARIELLEPVVDGGVSTGERVTIEGYENSVRDTVLNPKKKKWESCMPKMKSRDGDGVPLACYNSKILYSVDTIAWFIPKTLKKYTIS
jgi:methionine--tRNA ligase beta chain